MNLKKLGIIAGKGDLPKLIIEKCQSQNIPFHLILIKNHANPKDYKSLKYDILEYTQIGQVLDILKNNKVAEIVFVGGVKRPSFSEIKTDKKGAVLLSKIVAGKIFGDDNILTIITKFFAKEGFKVVGAHEIISDLVVQKGNLTKFKPNKLDLENIKIGVNALKTMADLDIGQALAVQQKQIIGVEAVEGTDELIKRCAKIAFTKGDKPILVKIKKQNQNKKVDLPTIGVKTISNLAKSGFKGIAFEAGSTLILEREKLVELADKLEIFVIATDIPN